MLKNLSLTNVCITLIFAIVLVLLFFAAASPTRAQANLIWTDPDGCIYESISRYHTYKICNNVVVLTAASEYGAGGTQGLVLFDNANPTAAIFHVDPVSKDTTVTYVPKSQVVLASQAEYNALVGDIRVSRYETGTMYNALGQAGNYYIRINNYDPNEVAYVFDPSLYSGAPVRSFVAADSRGNAVNIFYYDADKDGNFVVVMLYTAPEMPVEIKQLPAPEFPEACLWGIPFAEMQGDFTVPDARWYTDTDGCSWNMENDLPVIHVWNRKLNPDGTLAFIEDRQFNCLQWRLNTAIIQLDWSRVDVPTTSYEEALPERDCGKGFLAGYG